MGEAVSALAEKTKLAGPRSGSSPRQKPRDSGDPAAFIEWQAQILGCEAQPIDAIYANLENELKSATPAIIAIGTSQFLAVVDVVRDRMDVLTPGGESRKLPLSQVRDALRSPVEQQLSEEYSALLAAAEVPESRRKQAVEELLAEQTGQRRFQGGWVLRPQVGTSFWRFLREANVFRKGSSLVFVHLVQYLFWLTSWAILGRLSFRGQMDRAWLFAWALLLLGMVPLRALTTWLQGSLAVEVGLNLKRRLLLGALKTDPDDLRHQGVGSFLGQAFEAEAVESLALSGGITGVLAAIEIVVSGFVLGKIAILLGAWCLVTAAVGWKFLRHYQAWTGTRMEMTGDLVETMVGNRTRLAQQRPEDWHRQEDDALSQYIVKSSEIDRSGGWLVAFLPRGWLIAGLCCLAPAAISPSSESRNIALQLGGLLLAFNAFRKLTTSSVDIAAAIVAGTRIAPLFRSAEKTEVISQAAPGHSTIGSNEVIAEADKVTFRYRQHGNLTLHPSTVAIRSGEHILLEGPSGGGKSTFASLLSGMRKQDSGLVLINGLDSHTVGAQRWRKQVAASPQFHDNHILTETLAFNVLMGRSWPPSRSDMEEADAVCRELGLDTLLDRMPGGMMQMVGEGGWQLSHGERSRIYIARSLLQKADLVILDESFAALDPETLNTALQCTLKRAKTLLVIAHP